MIGRPNRFHGYNSLRFVYQNGKTVRGPLVSVKYTLNTRRRAFRCAVVVSKKINKSAVVRNRIRRRVYEQIRLLSNNIKQPYDLVVTIYSDQVATMPVGELQSIITAHLKNAGVLEL